MLTLQINIENSAIGCFTEKTFCRMKFLKTIKNVIKLIILFIINFFLILFFKVRENTLYCTILTPFLSFLCPKILYIDPKFYAYYKQILKETISKFSFFYESEIE